MELTTINHYAGAALAGSWTAPESLAGPENLAGAKAPPKARVEKLAWAKVENLAGAFGETVLRRGLHPAPAIPTIIVFSFSLLFVLYVASYYFFLN